MQNESPAMPLADVLPLPRVFSMDDDLGVPNTEPSAEGIPYASGDIVVIYECVNGESNRFIIKSTHSIPCIPADFSSITMGGGLSALRE